MKVFITGGSGFVGSAVIPQLLAAGHTVTALARNEAAATKLAAAGVAVLAGDVENLESLRAGAAASDGVIHLGFIHDFARFAAVCEVDRAAITAMADVLVGSDRPLVVTSGTAIIAHGQVATEGMLPQIPASAVPRVMTEEAVTAAAARGVRACTVRLAPTVHDVGDAGFVPMFIATAKQKQLSVYIGDGANRWNAVHRQDAAALFRLALEKATTGARYHAVGDDAVPFETIARAIGTGLGVPVVAKPAAEATEHFGFLGAVAQFDMPATSTWTQQQLGWQPTHLGLLADLANNYF